MVRMVSSTTRAHRVAIRLDLGQRRPVVMRLVQIIPGHLIDTDREHGFEPGIDPLVRDLGHDELVDVEGCRMPEIEDQRVPQRFRPQVEGLLRRQGLVKLLVQAVGGVEILPDFLALFVGVTLIEDRGSGVSQVHNVIDKTAFAFFQIEITGAYAGFPLLGQTPSPLRPR